MRAYQLKIQLNGLRPPVWRRLIVPADLTFSQLMVILMEAMGWEGEHMMSIEIPSKDIMMEDDGGALDLFGEPFGEKASEHYLDEFFQDDAVKSFRYIYDFGDDWQHKVTIEKYLEDYDGNCPKVIKYKGDCPPEDCGGVWGFAELLEEAKTDEEQREWLEESYHSYDMESVNAFFSDAMRIDEKKAEKRDCYQIMRDIHLNGKCGLPVKQKPASKKRKQASSPKAGDTDDPIDQMQAALLQANQKMIKANPEQAAEFLTALQIGSLVVSAGHQDKEEGFDEALDEFAQHALSMVSLSLMTYGKVSDLQNMMKMRQMNNSAEEPQLHSILDMKNMSKDDLDSMINPSKAKPKRKAKRT